MFHSSKGVLVKQWKEKGLNNYIIENVKKNARVAGWQQLQALVATSGAQRSNIKFYWDKTQTLENFLVRWFGISSSLEASAGRGWWVAGFLGTWNDGRGGTISMGKKALLDFWTVQLGWHVQGQKMEWHVWGQNLGDMYEDRTWVTCVRIEPGWHVWGQKLGDMCEDRPWMTCMRTENRWHVWGQNLGDMY